MDEKTEQRLSKAAEGVRDHFDKIDQDVPDKSFVVGGFVRDTIIGLEPKDMDFVVVGETMATMKSRGFTDIDSSSFPVLMDSDGQEWALAREEEKDGVGYDGFEVFTDHVSLKSDLKRRDLTINAIALSPDPGLSPEWTLDSSIICDDESWGIVNPYGGVEDINDSVLRHVSPAFSDDPLRTLRVARYAARFGFSVHDSTKDLMRQVAPELNLMSRDRIGDEILKALDQSSTPRTFFDVLEETGVLAVLWPDLHRATQIPAGPEEHHAEGDVYTHTMMVLERMNEICEREGITGEDRIRRLLMAVAHDCGKVIVGDRKGGIYSDDPPTGFPNHSNVGAEAMKNVCRRLGLEQYRNVLQDACELHMRFHDLPAMPLNELHEFVSDHFPSGLDNSGMRELPTNPDGEPHSFHGATAWELLDLAEADHTGRHKLVDGDVVVPEFDRTSIVNRIEAVFDAKQNVNGHEALETGLCDEHSECEIDRTHGYIESEDTSVQALMKSCDACRTPGEWVGKQLESMLLDEIERQLVSEDKVSCRVGP